MKRREFTTGRLSPCHAVNPELWRTYCAIVGRDPANVADHWTEQDVLFSLFSKGVKVVTDQKGASHDPQ